MSRVQNFLKGIFSSRKQKHKVSRAFEPRKYRSLPTIRQNAPPTGSEPLPELCPFCQKPQKHPKWCEQCQEFPPPIIEIETDSDSTSGQPAQGNPSDEIPYGICRKCYYPKTSQWWCNHCESLAFQAEFRNWSSGNKVIDGMIRKSQLRAVDELNYLEWVNYDEFEDVQLVVKSGLGKLHTAIWKTGPRIKYDQDLGEWMRDNDITIALKELNGSTNMTSDYIRKIEQYASCNTTGSNILKCFGLTFNPVTKNYLLIIDYCEHGNLNQYLDKHHADITWERRLAILHSLSATVFNLHEKNIFHQNLHGGNILMGLGPPMIADVGLCIPAYEYSNTKNVYGVLPFVAPEVLRGNAYTAAADVYSLGMLMWQLASGRPPFYNRAHDKHLAMDIRNRIKPKVINGVPECYQEFMERCWNNDPGERPTSSEVYSIVGIWFNQMMFVPGSEIGKQFWEAEDFRKYHRVSGGMNDGKHLKASYVSRLLSFPGIFYNDFETNGTNSKQTRIVVGKKNINEEEQDLPTTHIDSYNVNETVYAGVVADKKSINEEEQASSTTPVDETDTRVVADKKSINEEEQASSTTPVDVNEAVDRGIVADKKSINEEEQDLPTTPVGNYNVNEAVDTGVVADKKSINEEEQDLTTTPVAIVVDRKSINEEEQDLSTTPVGSYNVNEAVDTGAVADKKSINEEEQDFSTTFVGNYNVKEAVDTGAFVDTEEEQDLTTTPAGNYNGSVRLYAGVVADRKSIDEEEQNFCTIPIKNNKKRFTYDYYYGHDYD